MPLKKKMNIEKAIKGFYVEDKDFKKNLRKRIEYYYLQGFRVVKPATQRQDILYPRGRHRKEHIDNEILMLSYWVLQEINGVEK